MNKNDESITLSQYINDLTAPKYQYNHSQYSDELEKWAIRIDTKAIAAIQHCNSSL